MDDTHKKAGVVLLVLYLCQCVLGAGVHFVKPGSGMGVGVGVGKRAVRASAGAADSDTSIGGSKQSQASTRPIQNYAHAVLGLAVIALGFYQVRTGYKDEWPATTGRGDVPSGVNVAWIVWLVVRPFFF